MQEREDMIDIKERHEQESVIVRWCEYKKNEIGIGPMSRSWPKINNEGSGIKVKNETRMGAAFLVQDSQNKKPHEQEQGGHVLE